ncbi:HEAT repeat domain-containing protein [Streptomyces sp. MT29]|nr:HEAT repeat domain-containing protein [Streptomyces sp. MT29]
MELGAARADWAAEPVAACLAHPNMNIRKTAAETLAHAGGPQAVPHLLRRSASTTNPGLRDALTQGAAGRARGGVRGHPPFRRRGEPGRAGPPTAAGGPRRHTVGAFGARPAHPGITGRARSR